MASYKELLAQRAQLDEQIAAQRKEELADAIQKVRSIVAEYDLTADDVFSSTRGAKKSTAGSKVAPKFRNPETGATWTGRGKPPLWIAAATDEERKRFLIENQ
ncbi:H-NS histone family protein (plasmid) [Comamonas aquatica]|nr:H-NS histone family protein [Comamonas aquatica]